MKVEIPNVYADLHDGINTYSVDLKTSDGREFVNKKINQVDILLTSFRPSALDKLGLSWDQLSVTQAASKPLTGCYGWRCDQSRRTRP